MRNISADESIFLETLELLEWPLLCNHLSKFASTKDGESECKNLTLPTDFIISQLRLEETLEMLALDGLKDGGLSFKGVHQIGDILSRCKKGGIASGLELLEIAETLASARSLRRQIINPDLRPTLSNLVLNLSTLPKLEKQLKYGLEEGGRVTDRSSELLASVRQQRMELVKERRAKLQETLRTSGSIFHENVITERHGRPVLSLKAGAGSQLPGLVHGTSASGNTIFVEPQGVISLGNRIVEQDAQILAEERRLLLGWSNQVAEEAIALEQLREVLLILDVALARSRYGQALRGVPANLHLEKNSPFKIRNLRHPLLFWQYRNDEKKQVVPINLDISSSLKVVAITGPNTGGKTVTLKSIGLVMLMARAGLLVPCSGSPSFPWCDQVLADIGDDQSLEQNLSTFSSHVKRIGRILDVIQEGSSRSLILLDEVGAGTDPSEGSALAIGLLKVFADRSRLTIATTHLGELKALKYSDSRFENASVAFDSQTMSPTFQLQWGIPGRSNAIAIASRLGLDSRVIEKARDILAPTSDGEVNSIISGLEEQRILQQKAAEDAAALLARTELLHEQVLKRWENYSEQSEKIQEQGRQKLEQEILEGQKEVRNLIRQLRDKNANGETARKAGQRLRFLHSGSQALKKDTPLKNWMPKVGDQVRLIEIGKAGVVSTISDDGIFLTIQCGILRSKVHLNSIESLEGLKPAVSKQVVNVQANITNQRSNNSVRTSVNTIDVRGLRVHEAEAAIEEFLRNANGSIWVVHGIGTGKLKRGIRKWLQDLTYVKGFSDADKSAGGVGCTVVWLT